MNGEKGQSSSQLLLRVSVASSAPADCTPGVTVSAG